jgi:hypothetical protein
MRKDSTVNGIQNADAEDRRSALRAFLHDLSAPLSALALELESASRAASRGDDPSASLADARRTLEELLTLFEQGRVALLDDASETERRTRV